MTGFHPEGHSESDFRRKYTLKEITVAEQTGEILEAVAYMCDGDHNLLVDLGCMKGVIPRSEGAIGIAEGITRDIALISRVGKTVCFTVEELSSDGGGGTVALLSRKKAQLRCREEFLSGLASGDVINAKITHLESFGAFCDVGCGNVALMPIDAISVSRISHPSDRFSVGEEIRAIIKSVDRAGRITLSHKELLGTWEENVAQISQGETVSGVVRSVEDYGIFVELAPNLAGLAEPKDGVKVGQGAGVYIKSILPDKMKVKLIIIDTFDSPPVKRNEYFFKGEHIDRFIYSPENASKYIETVF